MARLDINQINLDTLPSFLREKIEEFALADPPEAMCDTCTNHVSCGDKPTKNDVKALYHLWRRTRGNARQFWEQVYAASFWQGQAYAQNYYEVAMCVAAQKSLEAGRVRLFSEHLNRYYYLTGR